MKKEDLIKPETFRLDFFLNNGFKRYICKKCGKGFWSLIDRSTCGDPPCDPYDFIGNPVIPNKYNWKEIRQKYIKWFEKNAHQPINRYPVPARWKPDTFYVGAGVFCFMPWVLNQTIEPPANPLVFSQPSIRFGDIDNVGLGSGRHMTGFEMLGHFAFNYPKKDIYWKEKTSELCWLWHTKALNIKPELITFKESWWEGGGNAGPCFEVIAKGNELATLVFMEYEGPSNGLYKPMELKVVDTGYGLERAVWASTGDPTIYDSVFGPIIKMLSKNAGIEIDKKIFSEFCKVCGILNIEDVDVNKTRKKIVSEIAKKLKISEKEIMNSILPFHSIYQIADHTRTLTFILADGIVPSNVQEGYLARLLLRRTIRNLKDLKTNVSVTEVIEKQIDDLKSIYPEFEENRNNVLKMIKVEEGKYSDTLKRGKELVRKIVAEKKELDANTLLLLYDSHGLLPRDIRTFVDSVKMPDLSDIDTKIAVKKSSVVIPVTKEIMDVSGLPETIKLYYDDEKMFEFQAKILKIGLDKIILDKTAFYPRGGGQEPDLGTIEHTVVTDVEKQGNVVVHFVESSNFKKGETVKCKIDNKRRNQISRHHTAAHIITGASRELLGKHVWQAGSKKDIDKAHLDITHYDSLSKEEVRKIGDLCNEIIKKSLKIHKKIVPRSIAERDYGFILYQGGAVPGRELRIIDIKGFNVAACGGIHLDNTKEVEKIFIFNTKKIQDGVVRIEFVAGKELVKKKKEELKETKKKEKETLERKRKILEEEKYKVKKYKKEDISKYKDDILFLETEDMRRAEVIGRERVKKNPKTFSIIVGNGIVYGIKGSECKKNIESVIKGIAKIMGGSAGGFKNEYKGGGPLKEKSKEAFEKGKKLIKQCGKLKFV